MPEEQKKYDVFISYSHEDAQYVTPIVDIIAVARPDLVFQDVKEIKKGQEWEPQLSKALDQANLVIVFWCRHSALSAYVKNECEKAIKAKKQILPVLLDDCALDRDLAKYQWIDLKQVTTHAKKAGPASKRFGANPIIKVSVITLAVLLISFFSLFILTKNNAGSIDVDPAASHQNQIDYDSIATVRPGDSMHTIEKRPDVIDSLNAKLAEQKVEKERTSGWLLIFFEVALLGIIGYAIIIAVLQSRRKRLFRKSSTRAAATLIEELNEQLPRK